MQDVLDRTYQGLSVEDDENVSVMTETKFSEQKLAAHCQEILKRAIEDRKAYDKKLDMFWWDFRDIKPKKLLPFIGCSNFSVPISSSSTDAVVPRIIENTLDFDEPIQFKPLNRSAEPFSDVQNQFGTWVMDTRDDLKQNAWLAILQAAWSGTGITEQLMDMEKENIEEDLQAYVMGDDNAPVMNRQTNAPLEVNAANTKKYFEQPENPEFQAFQEQMAQMPPEQLAAMQAQGVQPPQQFLPPRPYRIVEFTKKQRRWKKFQPVMLSRNIKDVYWPADCKSFQDAFENSFIWVRDSATKDYLKRMLQQDKKELWKNLDKVKIEGLEEKTKFLENDESQKNWIREHAEKTDKIEFWRGYGTYDIDGDGIGEQIVVLYHLKSNTIFGWEKFPFKHGRCPLVGWMIKPVSESSAVGVGYPEMLYHVKGELDHIHNTRMDRMQKDSDPTLLYTDASGYSPNKHQKGFGREWKLRSLLDSDIKYLQTPKAEGESYKDEEMVRMWSERLSSVDGRASGVQNVEDSNDTKGGIQAVIAEGNTKFRQMIRWISLGMRESFQQIFDLYSQFWGAEADEEVSSWVQEILDQPGNPLAGQFEGPGAQYDKFEALKQKFNVIMTSTKVDKELEAKRAMGWYEVLKTDPLFQDFPSKKIAGLREVARALGFKDVDDFVPTEDEMAAVIQAKQQAAMIQQQQALMAGVPQTGKEVPSAA